MDRRLNFFLRTSNMTWSLVTTMTLLLLDVTAAQPVTSVDYSTGFPCGGNTNNLLDLNMGGRSYPQLVADARGNVPTTCLLRLSPDQVGRAVSAFLPYAFPFTSTRYAFEVEFTYRISGINNGIGDGIAYVIHQDPRGDDALGAAGGSLGVYGATIVAPALVVEFDTCKSTKKK
jgi:Bacterial lectin